MDALREVEARRRGRPPRAARTASTHGPAAFTTARARTRSSRPLSAQRASTPARARRSRRSDSVDAARGSRATAPSRRRAAQVREHEARVVGQVLAVGAGAACSARGRGAAPRARGRRAPSCGARSARVDGAELLVGREADAELQRAPRASAPARASSAARRGAARCRRTYLALERRRRAPGRRRRARGSGARRGSASSERLEVPAAKSSRLEQGHAQPAPRRLARDAPRPLIPPPIDREVEVLCLEGGQPLLARAGVEDGECGHPGDASRLPARARAAQAPGPRAS